MAGGDSVQVDPKVINQLDAVRFRNGLVGVQIVLKDEYKPTPPWKEQDFLRFYRLAGNILDRVTDVVGEEDERGFSNLEGRGGFHPETGSCAISATVRFIDELLKQPEIAACVDAYTLLPETEAPPRELL